MAYRLVDEEPCDGTVEHVTFVAFMPGGGCAALPGPALIGGDVLPGESVVLDASERIPLQSSSMSADSETASYTSATALWAVNDSPVRSPAALA
ncbi:hypothetical protein ACFPIJ_52265 [Dactylosporangium cerinum]|uniref:Uncharacterized protein n=1 Tax=Dactylosporangium cerinum TaxID=1434730 RepID=A0ABV9WGM0_9ACTN